MTFDPAEHPHRRRNLLTGEWVLVSPHRARRPWQGEEASPAAPVPPHDPACFLCPGNARANGARNPEYDGPFVFGNDFAALLPDTPVPGDADPLRPVAGASGEARVLCYSPDHARGLGDLDAAGRRAVVDMWAAQSAELGARWRHVALFENRGAMMGASSPHPHGQVWAGDFAPTIVAAEDAAQRGWLAERGEVLLDAVATHEAGGERVAEANAHWLAIVPWWAAWPFETLIVARDPVVRLEQLGEAARDALAALLGALMGRYDRLFGVSFPYSFGWHGCPHGQGDDCAHWRLHAHAFPPLLRSATVRKHMVGFELLAEAQRDLTPEQAAARLRAA